MASALDCSVCMYAYDLLSERQPMSLLCGHTLCSDCISRMVKKECPSCRTPFITPVPNFSLRDMMTAAASTPEALMAKQEETAKVEAVTTKVGVLQVEIKRRSAAIVRAQRKVLEAQEELKQLKSTLPSFSSTASTSSSQSKTPQTINNQDVNKNKIIYSDSSLQVILVESDNLGDVLTTMSMSSNPAIYDFQGQEMKFTDLGYPTIISSGVTWRNGKIMLTSEQSLCVHVKGVLMEYLSVLNGSTGVSVERGGGITMNGCEIIDCNDGLWICNGSVVANNLKISKCATDSFTVWEGGTAVVIGCELSGSGKASIRMNHSSSMEGTGITITGAATHVLQLCGTAKLSLTECKMIRNPGTLATGAMGVLEDEASLKLLRCAIDGSFKEGDNTSVEIIR